MSARNWFSDLFSFGEQPSNNDSRFDDEFSRGHHSYNDDNWSSFSFHMNPHDDIFRMMEDLMKDFSQDNGFIQHFSSSDSTPYVNSPPPRSHQSLRDQVLKKPGNESFSDHSEHKRNSLTPSYPRHLPRNDIDSLFQNFFGRSFFAPYIEDAVPKQDTDLDAVVQEKGLDAILQDEEKKSSNQVSPFTRSFLTSESRTVIRKADGFTEQRIIKRLPDGSEETTIITQDPGSDEKRTEIRRSDGSVEVVKEPSNSDFQDSNLTLPPPSHPFHSDTMHPSINSFIKFFFGK